MRSSARCLVRHEIYRKLTVPIAIVGYGSIGRGTLPLLERHFKFDKKQLNFIEPKAEKLKPLRQRGYTKIINEGLTRKNYNAILTKIFDGKSTQNDAGGINGIVVNLSVDTGSLDIAKLCRKLNVLYIDTVVEPWEGFYFDHSRTTSQRSNYALREAVKLERASRPGGTTAISCCGANPGMVSWLLKEALLKIAEDTNHRFGKPKTREDWAELMHSLGVQGVHVAERDSQVMKTPRPVGTFRNTWSVEGFVSEGFQPAELGWGTHEKWFPTTGKRHNFGNGEAIFLEQPGGLTRIRTWCPGAGAQAGLLVTHNEAISIADYYTVGNKKAPVFRPTCHYAYHPCNDAVLSLNECLGQGKVQENHEVVKETDIVDGSDELGVLVYGHKKNALWYGSRLSNKQARKLCGEQNCTGMQVTSAVLAGLVWALENPHAGIVETDDMDYERCLKVQRPYLGAVEGHYTDWTPLAALSNKSNTNMFPAPARTDFKRPWQFANVLIDG